MSTTHFLISGQSNVDQWFHSGGGSVLEAFRQKYVALTPTVEDVKFYDVARGGSAIVAASALAYAGIRAQEGSSTFIKLRDNYWWNEDTDQMGPTFDLFDHRITDWRADGIQFDGIIWAQGEADTAYITSDVEAEIYRSNLSKTLNHLIELSGCDKIYIQALGDRSSYSENNHRGTDPIRKIQSQLASEDARLILATTIIDLELRDSVHLTTGAYKIAAKRMAVACASDQRSPQINAAGRSSNRIFLQADLSRGQNLAKCEDASGFRVSDQLGKAVITSIQTDPTGFITLTLDRAITDATVSYALASYSSEMAPTAFLKATGKIDMPVLPFEISAKSNGLKPKSESNGKIRGSDLANNIQGTLADDWIDAREGDDIIEASGGSDMILTGGGKDTIVFGAGCDVDVVLDFELGKDNILLRGMSKYDLSVEVVNEKDLEIRSPYGDKLVLRNTPLEALFWINEE